MKKTAIHSAAAPAAIGPYSQAIRSGQLVFLSGQIPLDPETMELVEGDFESSARRVFDNLSAVAAESGGSLNDIVKLSVYLTDLSDYPEVNRVMEDYFSQPFPARAAFAVAALPKNASIEVEGILALDG